VLGMHQQLHYIRIICGVDFDNQKYFFEVLLDSFRYFFKLEVAHMKNEFLV